MKSIRLAATLAALLAAAPLLSACHIGQDVSQGGHALTNSADANAPTSPHP